ncbi:lysozyme inhibitor LprI family protein [Pseudomonas putida]|uniref:Lysozyme inhibitor LprI family protein n=1 Tax=Pseudomonas putida TaxID=303 RepID=A0AAW6PJA5_PSEPU|nr:lysozyme inhibitor LprI family protein [Pseudomonas putida]MDF3870096.1 lysozyme inhibitor LprI family protein [Pseudomonas putida]MDF3879548.1 lysozyme inhibitor LprI family protein [Pseudomonas putida]
MIKHCLTGLALACVLPLAVADDYTPASSTMAMSECIQAETHVQDQRLNRVYKQLMGKLDAGQQKSLRDVQRKWLAYRDGNCQFHVQASGGTMAQLEGGSCMMDMTRDRAAELERVLSPGQ